MGGERATRGETPASPGWPRRVAVLYGNPGRPGGLGRLFAEGFRAQGCATDLVSRAERWSESYDLVLAYGHPHWAASLLPAIEHLAAMPREKRPFVYVWFIENIPDPRWPVALVRAASRLRGELDRRFPRRPEEVERLQSSAPGRLLLKGLRFRILAELSEFRRTGLLDGLAATSGFKADYLRRYGYEPIVVPIGYHPSEIGVYREQTKDVDVGFLGQLGDRRRTRLLERVMRELERRNVRVSVQTNLYGSARSDFLNRTKILFNAMRKPYDFHGLRFLFCAAHKVLLVSEPIADPQPFIAGKHLVTAPHERLAEVILFYLRNEERRREIVDAAHRLLCEEYTMEQMAGRILDDAISKRRERS